MKTIAYVIFVLLVPVSSFVSATQAEIAWEPNKFAYVTNEGDDSLLVIDLKQEKTIAILNTDKIPHALVFNNTGKGYINNRGSQTLTVIDGNHFKVINHIQLPAISFQLAISPDKKTLAVGYKDALLVSFIDTEKDEVIASVSIGKEPKGTKTKRSKHPYWSKNGKFVYIGDNVNQTVVKVEAQTFKVVAIIPVAGSIHHFTLDKTGEQLYVAHEKNKVGGTSISIIDVATDKVLKNIPLSLVNGEKAKGHHGAFDNSGRYFFHCNEGGKTVTIIDHNTMKIVKTLQAGMGAGHTYFGKNGQFAYIIPHKDNIVTVIDLIKQEVINNIEVGKGKKLAHSAYLTPDGGYLYAINTLDSIIGKIDLKQQKIVSTMPIGKKALIMVVR